MNRIAMAGGGAAICVISLAPIGFAAPGVVAADSAPRVETPLTAVPATPYDEAADAHQAVAAALARAAHSGKFVLLDFGGNWCPDCRITAGVFDLPTVRPWIDKNFEIVMIDIGHLNKNMDLGRRYDLEVKAVPTLVILAPNGAILNAGNQTALRDARGMTSQAIVDTIDGWIHKPG